MYEKYKAQKHQKYNGIQRRIVHCETFASQLPPFELAELRRFKYFHNFWLVAASYVLPNHKTGRRSRIFLQPPMRAEILNLYIYTDI